MSVHSSRPLTVCSVLLVSFRERVVLVVDPCLVVCAFLGHRLVVVDPKLLVHLRHSLAGNVPLTCFHARVVLFARSRYVVGAVLGHGLVITILVHFRHSLVGIAPLLSFHARVVHSRYAAVLGYPTHRCAIEDPKGGMILVLFAPLASFHPRVVLFADSRHVVRAVLGYPTHIFVIEDRES